MRLRREQFSSDDCASTTWLGGNRWNPNNFLYFHYSPQMAQEHFHVQSSMSEDLEAAQPFQLRLTFLTCCFAFFLRPASRPSLEAGSIIFLTVNLHSCLNELPFQYFSYNLKRKTAVDTSLPPVIWKNSIHNSYLENCRMKVRGLAATTVWNKLMLLWNIFGVNYFLKLVDTKFAFFRIPHFWPYHTRDI